MAAGMVAPRYKVKIKLQIKRNSATSAGSVKRKLQNALGDFPSPNVNLECLAEVIRRHADAEQMFAATFPSWAELRATSDPEEKPAKRHCADTVASLGPAVWTEVAGDSQDPADKVVQMPNTQQTPCQMPTAVDMPDSTLVLCQHSPEASQCRHDSDNVQDPSKSAAPNCGSKDSSNGAVASCVSEQATVCDFTNHACATEVTAMPPAAFSIPAAINRHSIAAQSDGTISLLPPNMLPVPGQTRIRHSSQLALSQLMLPPHQCYMSLASSSADPAPSDAEFQRLVASASDRKRQADKLRGRASWTFSSLSMYVQACLIYMKAVECALQLSPSADHNKGAVSLCRQTVDLLSYVNEHCETLPSNAVVRDGLRTLCERLAAVCVLRDCMLSSKQYNQLAEALHCLASQTRDTVPDHGRQGKMTDHVTNEPLACYTTSAVRPNPSLQARLVTGARQMIQFADLVRKSIASLQALAERDEARSNPLVTQVCMHLSAVCAGGGLWDGERVIAHAHHALKLLPKLDSVQAAGVKNASQQHSTCGLATQTPRIF